MQWEKVQELVFINKSNTFRCPTRPIRVSAVTEDAVVQLQMVGNPQSRLQTAPLSVDKNIGQWGLVGGLSPGTYRAGCYVVPGVSGNGGPPKPVPKEL